MEPQHVPIFCACSAETASAALVQRDDDDKCSPCAATLNSRIHTDDGPHDVAYVTRARVYEEVLCWARAACILPMGMGGHRRHAAQRSVPQPLSTPTPPPDAELQDGCFPDGGLDRPLLCCPHTPRLYTASISKAMDQLRATAVAVIRDALYALACFDISLLLLAIPSPTGLCISFGGFWLPSATLIPSHVAARWRRHTTSLPLAPDAALERQDGRSTPSAPDAEHWSRFSAAVLSKRAKSCMMKTASRQTLRRWPTRESHKNSPITTLALDHLSPTTARTTPASLVATLLDHLLITG
ncbi:hypothetical protein HYPSUDRAFT_209959 [Hypholoma sublateritium FD-334 SS-4]|uniref:Uncharacterized protein n=1 Tax=Hypholoma sublateritium (strain FD-334 SS-4) TaxID=945553 RepID=A0A0D2N174_HYPSF|nr:hypothetical protein HYPSUDRAFT_209959 [Hypholoma sublateritium FD-334 SS-4]